MTKNNRDMNDKDKAAFREGMKAFLERVSERKQGEDIPQKYNSFEIQIKVFLDAVYGWSESRNVISREYISQTASDITGGFILSSIKLFAVIISDYTRQIHIPKVKEMHRKICGSDVVYKIEGSYLYIDLEIMMLNIGHKESYKHIEYLFSVINEKAGNPELSQSTAPKLISKVTIPRLQLNLSDEQISVLYEQLLAYKFIDSKTDRDSFCWVFGSSITLTHIYSIIWTARSKQSFRELIESFGQTVTNDMIKTVEKLFYHKGRAMTLNKADSKPSFSRSDIDDIVIAVNEAKNKADHNRN